MDVRLTCYLRRGQVKELAEIATVKQGLHVRGLTVQRTVVEQHGANAGKYKIGCPSRNKSGKLAALAKSQKGAT